MRCAAARASTGSQMGDEDANRMAMKDTRIRAATGLPKATVKAKKVIELEDLEKKQKVQERRKSFTLQFGGMKEDEKKKETEKPKQKKSTKKEEEKKEEERKRKADSPLIKDQKVTGSGRKIAGKDGQEKLNKTKQKRDEKEGTQGNDEGSRGMKEQNNGENQEA